MAAGIPVVVGAETDDAGSPHRRRLAGDLLHHRAQPVRIRAPLLIGHSGQKPRYRCLGSAHRRTILARHTVMLT